MTTYLGPEGSHIGREESIADTAQVLGRLYDGIEFRGFAQETLEELAAYAGVPVWNGLTDQWHPTQMLADVLTIRETVSAELRGVSWTYVGDGRNNVARSILVTGAMLGMDVRIAAPAALQPPPDVQELAAELARASGGGTWVTDDAAAAVAGADVVYTDTWVSMGEPDSVWDERVELLRPYRVTPELMAQSGQDDDPVHALPPLHPRRPHRARPPRARPLRPPRSRGHRRRLHLVGVRGLPAGREPDAHDQGRPRLESGRLTLVSTAMTIQVSGCPHPLLAC